MISELTVRTASASQYLQQLCKHFAHKVTVRYDAEAGHVAFPCGTADMTARGDVLNIRCECPDPAAQDATHRIIDDHLLRFAWKEKLDLVWQSQETSDASSSS